MEQTKNKMPENWAETRKYIDDAIQRYVDSDSFNKAMPEPTEETYILSTTTILNLCSLLK